MPTDKSQAIRIEGLAALQKELRQMGAEFAKQLSTANKDAAEVVASAARSKASGRGGVAAKTAPSIKAQGEQRRSKVTIGGNAYPFAMGAEFGATAYRQFPAWRGSGSGAGYFLYPAIRSTRDEFVEVYERVIDHVARGAFPN